MNCFQVMKIVLPRQKADYFGITGSVLCIIHCLITPLLVMSSTLLKHDTIRVGFLSLDYLFIGVNILAVWSASRHTSWLIRGALWSFLVLFAAGLLFEDVHEAFAYGAYAASLGLVVTHLANIRYYHTHHVH
jgi:MerC mercury resistance protein